MCWEEGYSDWMDAVSADAIASKLPQGLVAYKFCVNAKSIVCELAHRYFYLWNTKSPVT